ncbi:hypothetical protein GCM10023144_36700 [Pigmentiphaga soli]|uniref:Acetyl-CoA acetyltransferase n=1 Tax=Pigmentiphaga soli TaxID=1007095 RepID=A0ABP8HGD9_9BURK
MKPGAMIVGCGCRLGQPFDDRMDVVIRQAVLTALDESGMSIQDIDSVVTVAGDTLDGLMVASGAEVAGSYGRRYMNVPSSAGHGLAAAATQIESQGAENVLLVGWGAATRYGGFDPRRNQADPFHARPIGASPAVVAALQANELGVLSGLDETALRAYVQEMSMRAWGKAAAAGASAVPDWARTGFCDGVAAIVLRPASDARRGVRVRDFASVSRGYSPEDDSLDPAKWVGEAVSALSGACARKDTYAVVEAAAPTPIAEIRALSPFGFKSMAQKEFNPSGGGAAAHFGQATALYGVAETSRRLVAGGKGAQGLVVDLTGPLGQHVTAISLQAEVAQ